MKNTVLLLLLVISATLYGQGPDIHDTRLLSEPAVSEQHIAFVYAEDIWVAKRDGTEVRRLTSHTGRESRPRFSPDGQTIAFTGEYDGNTDVYIVPTAGGTPQRLTWHPGTDMVQDFTPDGKAILFSSPREAYTNRHTQLYTIPTEGGFPQKLKIPHAFKATYTPDGSKIAYTPLYEAFHQWKNYRGGTATRIWIYDVSDDSIVEIPQPQGRSNDTDPMWMGDRVYFRSDRNGEFNLFSYNPATEEIEQLTSHDDFPVVNASAGQNYIVYEQAGWLHLYDVQTNTSQRLKIGVPADLTATRTRWVKGDKYMRGGSISPSGARAVVGFRGDIVTVPAEKGDFRNITQTQESHERYPVWSPDGQWIAYFSDTSGEYQLIIAPQDGKGEVKTFSLNGAGFYEDPKWSPDGTKISYTDNSLSLFILDVGSGDITKVATEPVYSPIKLLSHSWSPDSKWLAYTQSTENNFGQVHVYSVENATAHAITDGLSDASSPVFDANGKHLYFAVSTDAGPVRDWFAMSNADMKFTHSLYMAVLPKGEISPLAKESDEEKGETSEEEGKDEEEEKNKTAAEVGIDFENLNQRILALPVSIGYYTNLMAGEAGQLYFIRAENSPGVFGNPAGNLQRFDLESREATTLLEQVSFFQLSADKEKILVSKEGKMAIAPVKNKDKIEFSPIDTDEIQIKIDPQEEWEQIYHEAWRINRDYFYDPNMHGADWPAMREKYEIFLPHLTTRHDLNRVIRWMCSELAVGHHNVGGGDFLYSTDNVPGGLLGADLVVNNERYQFAKVYGGLNWNPELRSPLTEPGVDVQAGEYLLAVNGQELQFPDNPYRYFEATAGKIVEITVGNNPDGSNARTVKVVPIENEASLRNRDWVEGNLRKVTEATDGRVAYVYVPNTTTLGHTYFKRYFYPQSDREAIIIDERHNGGGQVADYYIDILRRPYISHWAMRYGKDIRTPLASIVGPKVMLIDETAGSGGDLLPWMFKKLDMGPLIGRPTWGGLVGTLGFPVLMDGGFVTAPNLAIWTEDGFIVENVGVSPDIEVEQLPKEVIEGHDPQLERAIEEVLKMLEENPPKEHHRPTYPVRVRGQ